MYNVVSSVSITSCTITEAARCDVCENDWALSSPGLKRAHILSQHSENPHTLEAQREGSVKLATYIHRGVGEDPKVAMTLHEPHSK